MLQVPRAQAVLLYNEARKWFTLTSLSVFPVLFVINAPFGRFTPSNHSIFLVDGIKSWIVMELVSPICFALTYLAAPLSFYASPYTSNSWIPNPRTILASAYLLHYANRALISPLRTPSRSKSHIIVPLAAVIFNITNGSLMGSYLSSPYARIFLSNPNTYRRPSFWIGLALWAVGFAGNIWHDEILLNIRRKAKSKGKGKAEEDSSNGSAAEDSKSQDKAAKQAVQKEHYAIPHGWLYEYVSYPNYFCEWVEWFGFALAASPIPVPMGPVSWSGLLSVISEPAYLFAPNLSPPWIFLLSEVVLMLPRAFRGHEWYKTKFGDSYPRGRKVVVPFLL